MAAGFRYCCSQSMPFSQGKEENIRIALNPFVSVFLQLGHTRASVPSSVFSSVNCTSTSDLSEYAWRLSSVDAGQIGVILTALLAATSLAFVDGVNEGTQKEGRADLLDSDCGHSLAPSIRQTEKGKQPSPSSAPPSTSPVLLSQPSPSPSHPAQTPSSASHPPRSRAP